MAKSLKIDLFTDIVCPWCLVGSARLDQAIARLGPDVTVDIENHPFYLDPNAPAEGVVVADMLREKYGREPREMWERVEGEARATGIALDLSKQPRAYPTARAHTLIRAARAKGTQHALATAITEAYFLEHRQINDPDILAEIAIRFGFDRQEALQVVGDADALGETEDLALDAARQGINGVPFFIFQRRLAMSGCQPAEVFDQALARALQESVPAA